MFNTSLRKQSDIDTLNVFQIIGPNHTEITDIRLIQ